jgi:hypothetical protein
MGNLWPVGRMRPFKLFRVALQKPLKYRYFIEKSTKSVVKAYTLALNMAFLTKNWPSSRFGLPMAGVNFQNSVNIFGKKIFVKFTKTLLIEFFI